MKQKIIETSLQQFLEHGIRNITMQKLVAVLGISTKTMYKYFSNKEELLEECVKLQYRGADENTKKMVEGSPNVVVALVGVFSKSVDLDFGTNHLFYQDLNYYYPELQDTVIKKYAGGALETILALIQEGIDEEYFLSYMKAPVVMETLTVLYSSVTRNNAYKTFEKKPELIKHTIAIYLRGICTDKGLQIINQLKEITN